MKSHSVTTFLLTLSLALIWSCRAALSDDCDIFIPGVFTKTSKLIPGPIRAVDIQRDGKIIFAGDFVEYNGIPRKCIVRVNTDGSIDSTFDPGVGVAGGFSTIAAVVVQPDGKILISGSFSLVNGKFQAGIARLCQNGRLDTSFEGVSNEAYASNRHLFVQPDGKVLLGGQFSRANSITPNVSNLARFNADGTLDRTFIGRVTECTDLALLPSGDILYTRRGPFLKLTAGGESAAGGFQAPPHSLQVLHVLADGRFYAGSLSSSVDKILLRLHPNGSVDPTFDASAAITALDSGPRALTVQPDGKVIVCSFSRMMRLNGDGSRDPSLFVTNDRETIFAEIPPGCQCALVAGAPGWVKMVPLGNIPVSPSAAYSPQPAETCCTDRWLGPPDHEGLVDGAFDARGKNRYEGREVCSAAVFGDGSVLLGGSYDFKLSTPNLTHSSSPLARVMPGGSMDTGFVFNGTSWGSVHFLFPEPNGEAIAVFTSQVVRVRRDGSIAGNNLAIQGSNLLAGIRSRDGSIVLAGGLHTAASGWTNLVRISPGLTVTSFYNSPAGTITALEELPDRRLLVATSGSPKLVRMNLSGGVDGTFSPDVTGIHSIRAIRLDSKGRIVIAGTSAYPTQVKTGFVRRLLLSGAADPNFNADIGLNYYSGLSTSSSLDVRDILIQPDDRIVCAGNFEQVDGILWPKICRLDQNGRLDRTFARDFAWDRDLYISRLYPLADGKILATGTFGAAILHGKSSPPELSMVERQLRFRFRTIDRRTHTVEFAEDPSGGPWRDVFSVAGDDTTREFEIEAPWSRAFFRLRSDPVPPETDPGELQIPGGPGQIIIVVPH